MTLTPKHRLILGLVAFLAAVGAYWFLLLSPKREEVAQIKTEVTAKQVEVETAKGQIALYEKARANYRRNYTVIARLGKAVPADDDVRSLLVQVDAAARHSGAGFRTLDLAAAGDVSATPGTPGGAAAGTVIPGTTVGTAGFASMPFNLTFSGDFHELSRVLTDLQGFVRGRGDKLDVSGRLLLLKTFTLQPDGEDWHALSASVSATSYLLPGGEGLLAGATAGGPAGATPVAGQPAPTTPPATTAALPGVTP